MHTIRIDTSRLTYPWLWIPGRLPHFVDGSVRDGAPVRLPAGTYPFQQTRDRASDLRFTVTEEGAVDYPAVFDHLLGGRGTSTLRVRGVEMELHPTGRARPILPLWGGCREPLGARTRRLRIPPGSAYAMRLLHLPRRVVEFHVAADGSVDYPRDYDETLSGRGSGVLTVDLDRLHHEQRRHRARQGLGQPAPARGC
jgi:hypothetical protein